MSKINYKIRTKQEKISAVEEMSFDGVSKAKIAEYLGIGIRSFQRNNNYRSAWVRGNLQKEIHEKNLFVDAYNQVGKKHGLTVTQYANEIQATKLDNFILSKKDFKTISSLKDAITRVILAENEAKITPKRGKDLIDRLMKAIDAKEKSIEYDEFIEWKNGLQK